MFGSLSFVLAFAPAIVLVQSPKNLIRFEKLSIIIPAGVLDIPTKFVLLFDEKRAKISASRSIYTIHANDWGRGLYTCQNENAMNEERV